MTESEPHDGSMARDPIPESGADTVPALLGWARTFVWAMALYLPFEETLLAHVPRALYAPMRYGPEALILLLAVGAVWLWVTTGQELRYLQYWSWAVVICLAFAGSAYVNAIPAKIAILGSKNLVRFIALFLVVQWSRPDVRFAMRLVRGLVVIGAIQGAIGLGQMVLGARLNQLLAPTAVVAGELVIRADPGSTTLTQAAFGTLGRYNLYGNFLGIAMLLAVGLAPFQRWQRLMLIALITLGIGASYSRMSWVGVAVGLTFLLWWFDRRVVVAGILLVALGTGIAVSTVEVDWQEGEREDASLIRRYVGMFQPGYIEKSMKGDRLYALFVTAPTVLEVSPWWGLGPGAIASEVTGGGVFSEGMYPQYDREHLLSLDESAVSYTGDNGWVALLAQTGMIGLGTYLVLIAMTLHAAWRLMRQNGRFTAQFAQVFVAIVASVCVQNFFSFNLIYRPVSFYFWLFAGLVVSFERLGRRPLF